MRSIKVWTCEYCSNTFERAVSSHIYHFCCHHCASLANKTGRFSRIEDGQPMSIRTQYRRLEELGLTRPFPRYPIDETFFDAWSDGLAWIIGLIWSDGCLISNRAQICSRDRDMLEIVTNLIGQENGVHAWYVSFPSKKATAFLKNIGLIARKSLTITWPDIPEQWEASFMRGILDGDGSVCLHQRRKGQQASDCSVLFYTASTEFAQQISSWMKKHDIRHNLRQNHAPVWQINVVHQSSLRVLYTLLYPNKDTPCLHRKRAKFDLWISTPRYDNHGRLVG